MPERDADAVLEDVIRAYVRAGLAHVHTTMPAKVLSFDATGDIPRATVKLAVKFRRLNSDGQLEQYAPPNLPNLPVSYQMVGSKWEYFPLAAGDEVMVHFAERDIDNAVDEGEDLNDAETTRRHSLMDAVVYPRSWSTSVPVGSRDDAWIIEAALIKLGDMATEFATTSNKVFDALAAIKAWADTHEHSGVTAGAADTGPPSTLPPTTTLVSLQADKVKIE